jgi:hypothetical protein
MRVLTCSAGQFTCAQWVGVSWRGVWWGAARVERCRGWVMGKGLFPFPLWRSASAVSINCTGLPFALRAVGPAGAGLRLRSEIVKIVFFLVFRFHSNGKNYRNIRRFVLRWICQRHERKFIAPRAERTRTGFPACRGVRSICLSVCRGSFSFE